MDRAVAGECVVRYHDCSTEQLEVMTEKTRSEALTDQGVTSIDCEGSHGRLCVVPSISCDLNVGANGAASQ